MSDEEWLHLMTWIDIAAQFEFDGRDRDEQDREWRCIPKEHLQWWLW